MGAALGSEIRAPVRWGVPDALICWLVGLVASTAAVTLVVSTRSPDSGGAGSASGLDPQMIFLVVLPVQGLAQLGALAWISRVKGLGSMAADFGLSLSWRRSWLIAVGIGLQFAFAVILIPILEVLEVQEPAQDLIRQAKQVNGISYLGVALSAGLLAPLVEETLFRGLLLRALMRRMHTPVAVLLSALLFGLAHVPDNLSAAAGLPAFIGLGILLGAVAVSTGSLAGPVFLHAGFNLATVGLLLLDR